MFMKLRKERDRPDRIRQFEQLVKMHKRIDAQAYSDLGIDLKPYALRSKVSEDDLLKMLAEFSRTTAFSSRGLPTQMELDMLIRPDGVNNEIVSLKALYDNGCHHSSLSRRVFDLLAKRGYQVTIVKEKIGVLTASSDVMKLDRYLTLPFCLWPSKEVIVYRFWRCDVPKYDCFLGSDIAHDLNWLHGSRSHVIVWSGKLGRQAILGSVAQVSAYLDLTKDETKDRKDRMDSQEKKNNDQIDRLDSKEKDNQDKEAVNPSSYDCSDFMQDVTPITRTNVMAEDEPYFESISQAKMFLKHSAEEGIHSKRFKMSSRNLKVTNGKFYDYMRDWVETAFLEGGTKQVKETLVLKRSEGKIPLGPLEDIEDIIADIQFQMEKEKLEMPKGAEFEVFTGIERKDLHFSGRESRKIRLYIAGSIPRRALLFQPLITTKTSGFLIPHQIVKPVEDEENGNYFEVMIQNCRVPGTGEKISLPPLSMIGHLYTLEDDYVQSSWDKDGNLLLVRDADGKMKPPDAESSDVRLSMPMVDWSDYQDGRNDLNLDNPEELKVHAQYVREDMLKQWRENKHSGAHDLNMEEQEAFGQVCEELSPFFNAYNHKYAGVNNKKVEPMRIGVDPDTVGKPIHVARTTKNVYQREYISSVVREMAKHDIIRPSKSEWAFPVVLAKKPNGKLRFCVNYAGLNLRTVPDRYPLPRIDEMLSHLKGKKYLSKFDCLNAFWSLPLHESDKKYSAFRTHEGLFEWNVCPFGMTNIPSAFQRTMDTILAGLKGINCLGYIDLCTRNLWAASERYSSGDWPSGEGRYDLQNLKM